MADEQGLTKEQFIKQYGYDPEPEAVAEAPPVKVRRIVLVRYHVTLQSVRSQHSQICMVR